MESKIEIKSNKDDVNTHIYEITNHLSKLDEEIEALKKPDYKVGLDWINSHLNINEIKKLKEVNSRLQQFTYYNGSGQQINLQNDDWSIRLKEYEMTGKNVVALVFGVSIENNIIIKKEKTSHIGNIRITLYGNIIENKLFINPNQSAFSWEEI
jgi:hypothetical protein